VSQAEGGPGTDLPRSTAPVAQMDRAGGFYPSGCRFDSCRGHYQEVWEGWEWPCASTEDSY
jgi:hypothetical protein